MGQSQKIEPEIINRLCHCLTRVNATCRILVGTLNDNELYKSRHFVLFTTVASLPWNNAHNGMHNFFAKIISLCLEKGELAAEGKW